jgi:hypothetical protein
MMGSSEADRDRRGFCYACACGQQPGLIRRNCAELGVESIQAL